MKDTVTAKTAYKVFHSKTNPCNIRVRDGQDILFDGVERTWDDYIDECVKGNNEMALQMDVFTTDRGNQFVYWIDLETGEDFISRVPHHTSLEAAPDKIES